MTRSHTTSTIALVTGGSRGIGKSIVQHIAARGTDVIFTYQSRKAEADALVSEVEGIGRRAAALQLDVGDTSTLAAFTEQVRGVLHDWRAEKFHFLIHNAGIGAYIPVVDTTEAQFDQLMNIHVKGPLFLTQQLLPLMADGGRIVNMSSAVTRVTFPGNAVYASAKAAVEVMTKYLAAELGSRQITANVIAPGGIATDFNDGVMLRPDMQVLATSITALGRTGQPEDVGSAVAALLAPEMGWVNGQHIEASGGQNL
jgi:NAD(P)-dependent dehydrogenase (short-subunit alcohol dehydrogenase family)